LAGGKRQIVPHLSGLAPSKFDWYIEPFLGGGALFFHLISNKNKPLTAYIYDIHRQEVQADWKFNEFSCTSIGRND
jgi:DNA adenine methylase